MGPTSVRRLYPWQVLLILLAVLMITPLSTLAAEISGIVTNAEGGEPLGKIVVSVSGTSFSAITSADGKFRITGLPTGKYVLQARGLGYRTLSELFALTSADDSKEFVIHLTPDAFRRSETVEVHGDVFEPAAWPAVGDMNLTSSEIQETSTVIANDPYRSIQSLSGVSASGNDDLFAQFSVMGTPYEQVGVYVDDVRVPNLLHTIPSFPDAPSLSLFTGNGVEELRLMPVAFPVRYAEDNGAALVITTRTGTDGPPLFHVSVGVGDSEFVGEGGFGGSHHGTWLFSARKSYIGYLTHFFNSSSFSDVGFYDANVKFSYDLTPANTISLFATGGQTHINDPSLPPTSDPSTIKKGSNDVGIGRLGWRWQASPRMVLDTRMAYVRSGFDQQNPTGVVLDHQLDREWSTGTIFSWNWREGGIVEAGYSTRWPHLNEDSNFFFSTGQPPISSSSRFVFQSQNAFVQFSQQFWKQRLRLEGGVRWAKQGTIPVEPVTGQASASLRLLRNTLLEAGWGKYDQFLGSGGALECGFIGTQVVCFSPLPYASSQYIVAIEQHLGTRTRVRLEAFDRQNEIRDNIYLQNPSRLVADSLLSSRDYSRGMQLVLQRRSENRLSGWIGYTLVYARQGFYPLSVPQIPAPISPGFPYEPTLVDQRHSVNLFATCRLTPTWRLSVKNLYGSGYPVEIGPPAVMRLSPYERLDLRVDKSWLLNRWKLSLYGELLNATNHYNPIFQGTTLVVTGPPIISTTQGVPITPTVGLAFDF
jgi:hypothetical protein